MKDDYDDGYREGFQAGVKVLKDHPEIEDGHVPRKLWPDNPYELTTLENKAQGWQVGFFDSID